MLTRFGVSRPGCRAAVPSDFRLAALQTLVVKADRADMACRAYRASIGFRSRAFGFASRVERLHWLRCRFRGGGSFWVFFSCFFLYFLWFSLNPKP